MEPSHDPNVRAEDKFTDRYPDLDEILAWGGLPGVQYLYAYEGNTNSWKLDGWSMCRNVDTFSVTGPEGTAGVIVMARGEPIPGAAPTNGVRECSVDKKLDTLTGLGDTNGEELVERSVPVESPKDPAGRQSPRKETKPETAKVHARES